MDLLTKRNLFILEGYECLKKKKYVEGDANDGRMVLWVNICKTLQKLICSRI